MRRRNPGLAPARQLRRPQRGEHHHVKRPHVRWPVNHNAPWGALPARFAATSRSSAGTARRCRLGPGLVDDQHAAVSASPVSNGRFPTNRFRPMNSLLRLQTDGWHHHACAMATPPSLWPKGADMSHQRQMEWREKHTPQESRGGGSDCVGRPGRGEADAGSNSCFLHTLKLSFHAFRRIRSRWGWINQTGVAYTGRRTAFLSPAASRP